MIISATETQVIEEVDNLDGIDFPSETPVRWYLTRRPGREFSIRVSTFWERVIRAEAAEYTISYRVVRRNGVITGIGFGLKGSPELHSTWYLFG